MIIFVFNRWIEKNVRGWNRTNDLVINSHTR